MIYISQWTEIFTIHKGLRKIKTENRAINMIIKHN